MMSNEAKNSIEHSELDEDRMIATLSEQPSSGADALLPSSVKGAPEELKPAIRKKQNKESARRSRQRKNEMIGQMATAIMTMVNRMNAMESRINKMEGYLRSQGIISDSSASLNQAPVQTADPLIQQPSLNNLPIPGNRSDDSLAQDVSSRTNSSNADDQMEDDVNNLIQRCLQQFE